MDRIGKYEILGEIGAGGFGTVYRGRDPILKRMVAIKTCSSEDSLLRQRFRREAEIVAGLQHPNITTVHDLGEQDGVPYLVQEFLDGEDLSHIIGRRDELSMEQRARMLFGVASGLAHAHANGIIHRDIKPSNIRVLSNGTVKVMDFGIAKVGDVQTELTRTGMMLGTGPYLAPEQLTDEQLDSRCDIFSFGIVAYELFAYQRPFEASTFSALLYKILNQPHTPIRELCPQLSEPLVELVERCLIKDRERRIGSFEEIRSQLAQVLNISEERKVPTSSQTFLDPTVSYDSGATERQIPLDGADQAMENSATILVSSREASAAAMREAASFGGPAEATNPSAPAHAGAKNRTVPLVAAAVVVAGLAVGGAVLMRGDEEPTDPGSLPSAVVGAAPGGATAVEATSNAAALPTEPTDGPTVGGSPPSTSSPEGAAGGTSRPEPTQAATAPPSRPTTTASPPEGERPSSQGGGGSSRTPVSQTATSTATPPGAAGTGSTAAQSGAGTAPASQTSTSTPPPSETSAAISKATESTTTPPAGTREPAAAAATVSSQPTLAEPSRPPAAQPEPTIPQGPDPAIEEAGVRAAIERYRKAYEALDIEALSAAWPSLDGESKARIGRGFSGFQALSMTIDGCSIDVTGATAVARCVVHQQVTPKGGRHLTSDRDVEFRLTKRGDAWVIQNV